MFCRRCTAAAARKAGARAGQLKRTRGRALVYRRTADAGFFPRQLRRPYRECALSSGTLILRCCAAPPVRTALTGRLFLEAQFQHPYGAGTARQQRLPHRPDYRHRRPAAQPERTGCDAWHPGQKKPEITLGAPSFAPCSGLISCAARCLTLQCRASISICQVTAGDTAWACVSRAPAEWRWRGTACLTFLQFYYNGITL